MPSQKKFSTFDEQIKLLKTEKHLVITDETYAKDVLMRIGYFPLFGGYKHLFRIPLTKKYKEGTTFNEIVALYEFDSNLRELFFKLQRMNCWNIWAFLKTGGISPAIS